jgi:hypothetical protein
MGKKRVSYRNHLIFGESFQRMKFGSWVAQYTVVRQAPSITGEFPSQQYQFNALFRTKNDATAYALRKAKERIDKD